MAQRQYIDDEAIAQAHRELSAERRILLALKKVADPLQRARILRAAAALVGLDEK